MTDQPSWATLFERADGYEATTEQVRQELAALRESDE